MQPLTIVTPHALEVHSPNTPVQTHPPPELTHLLPPLVTLTSTHLHHAHKSLSLSHHPLTVTSHLSHLAIAHASHISLVNLSTFSILQTLPLSATPISLSFQPTSDARYLACASSNAVFLFSRLSYRQVSKFSHPALTAIAFSPLHPTLLAATDQVGCVIIWDISKALTKSNSASLHGRFHASLRAPATCLSFMKDGLLCVGGLDKQLRVLEGGLKRVLYSVTCSGPVKCLNVGENVAAVGLTTGAVQLIRVGKTSGKVLHEVKCEGVVRAVYLWAGEIPGQSVSTPVGKGEEWDGELFSPVVKTPAKGRSFHEDRKRVGFVTPRAKTVHEVTSENMGVNGKGLSEESMVSEEDEEEISPSRRLPRGVLQSRNVGALRGAVPSLKVDNEDESDERIRRTRSASVAEGRGREGNLTKDELPRAGTVPGKEGDVVVKEVVRMGTPVRERIGSDGQRVMTPVEVRWTSTAKQGRDLPTVSRDRVRMSTPLREVAQRKVLEELEEVDEDSAGDYNNSVARKSSSSVTEGDLSELAALTKEKAPDKGPENWAGNLRTVISEELGTIREELRKDIMNIHSELVVVAARHSEEIEKAFTDRDRRIQQLENEVERLRDDNRRLREKYGLMRIGGGN